MNSEKNPVDLSIIIPAYNEEDRIGPTILQIMDLINDADTSVELIIVDDGSIDGTKDTILDLCKRYTSLLLVSHDRNKGKGAAVRTGVFEARGQYIVFTDADFSYPFTRLHEILDALQEYDIVIGSRIHPESKMIVPPPFHRKLVAHIFSYLVRFTIGLEFADTQCGFKGFRRAVAHELFSMARIDGFAFDAEILAIARLRGYRTGEIPVSLVHSFGSRLSIHHDALIMALDLIRIRRYLNRGLYAKKNPVEDET